MLRFMEMFLHTSKRSAQGEMSYGAPRPRDLSLLLEQESTASVPAAPGTMLASNPSAVAEVVMRRGSFLSADCHF